MFLLYNTLIALAVVLMCEFQEKWSAKLMLFCITINSNSTNHV